MKFNDIIGDAQGCCKDGMYLFTEKNGEKHGKHDPIIECINEAFKVRFENFLISAYTRTGK